MERDKVYVFYDKDDERYTMEICEFEVDFMSETRTHLFLIRSDEKAEKTARIDYLLARRESITDIIAEVGVQYMCTLCEEGTVEHEVAFEGCTSRGQQDSDDGECLDDERKMCSYFEALGVDPADLRNPAKDISWIVFDRLGNFIETKQAGYEEMLSYNREHNYFANNLESFTDRNGAWYEKSLLEKLTSLGWKTSTIGGVKVIADLWGNAKGRTYYAKRMSDGSVFKFMAKDKQDAWEMLSALDGYELC